MAIRSNSIYVALGAPGNLHASYHAPDGHSHWKMETLTKPPLPGILEPVLIQNATIDISNETLEQFNLAELRDRPVDQVIFMDNRVLPDEIYYHVLAVPPFKHVGILLMPDRPAHIYISTLTN